MAIQELGDYNNLFGITRNTEDNALNVRIGIVSYDNDVQCICDAIEFLAEAGEMGKSINIRSFNAVGFEISKGESPVEVYRRIQKQFGRIWYWEKMPKAIAEAQAKFEARQKANNSQQAAGSEPGEKE